VAFGELCPQSPHFGAEMGIFSLDVESNNFSTAEPILVIRSSNNAAPRKELTIEVRKLKFAIKELALKTPQNGASQPKYLIP
jgi:hypothetical protein